MKDRRGEVWDCGENGVLLIVGLPRHELDLTERVVQHLHKALDLVDGRVYTFVETTHTPFEDGSYKRIG